ncbi:putative 3-phosphoinositide-dependent protein kinase 2 [Dromiciops gliroides]|uniref:putative 3-phosphoinositide-dependent protein kinase 2 n=1 Tax=Dromiciops gliroides TaxID=33562 RepID=UPI001CC7D67C|nr:putative 3-phosphoinositide-dependent protein kinase 2 [Dromiciops gliroides]
MASNRRCQLCPGAQLGANAPFGDSPSAAMQPDRPTTSARAPMDPAAAAAATAAQFGITFTFPEFPPPEEYRKYPWSKRPEDFIFGKVLSEGAYTTVVVAREMATSREYAMKILDKKQVAKARKVGYVTNGQDVLARLDHPLIVKLYFTMSDKDKLYLGLSCAPNGDLVSFVQNQSPLDEACVRFYAAELASALQYLHSKDIIHRNLKPENVLFTAEMHIQVTGFGPAKRLPSWWKKARACSFVGTPQYVAPELLTPDGARKSTDLWILGCLLYYLGTGRSPFQAENDYLTFLKIIQLAYDFPKEFFPKAKDLVEKLLVSDPTKRVGCEEMGGYGALKAHPFFENITWDTLHLQTPPQVRASLAATLENEEDFGDF